MNEICQAPRAVSIPCGKAAFDRFGSAMGAKNVESRVRPVIDTSFGKVKMWNVPNVRITRPGISAPGSLAYESDVKYLSNMRQ